MYLYTKYLWYTVKTLYLSSNPSTRHRLSPPSSLCGDFDAPYLLREQFLFLFGDMYGDAGVLDLDLRWFQRTRGEEAVDERTRSKEEPPFVAVEVPRP